MIVFDTKTGTVVGEVKDLKRVHGVLAVPELHRVFASATGTNELVVIDDRTLQIQARISAGDYPDGIRLWRVRKGSSMSRSAWQNRHSDRSG